MAREATAVVRVDLEDMQVRTLLPDDPRQLRSQLWLDEDAILLGSGMDYDGGVWRLDAATGELTQLYPGLLLGAIVAASLPRGRPRRQVIGESVGTAKESPTTSGRLQGLSTVSPHSLRSRKQPLHPQTIILVGLLSSALACVGLFPSPTPRSATPPSSEPPSEVPSPLAPALTVDSFLVRCPTAAEVASIDAQVDLTFARFVAFPTATIMPDGSMTFGQMIYGPRDPLVCLHEDGSADLDALQLRAYQSLLVMRQLDFDEPLPWTSQSLYDWFVGAFREVRFEEGPGIEFSECCQEK